MSVKNTLLASVLQLLMPLNGFGIEQFVESFGGDGFFSADVRSVFGDEQIRFGLMEGFDNPGWQISDSWNLGTATSMAGVFSDGTLHVDAKPEVNNPFGGSSYSVSRELTSPMSFVHDIRLRDVDLIPGGDGGPSTIIVQHDFDQLLPTARLYFQITVQGEFEMNKPPWIQFIVGDNDSMSTVELGSDIGISIQFDHVRKEASLIYDNNVDDENAGLRIGPLAYDGPIPAEQSVVLHFISSEAPDRTIAGIDSWTLSAFGGDFDGNGSLEISDIDSLIAEIRRATHDSRFDLNSDKSVDDFDLNVWVHDLANTFFGDASLDGEFNTRDLVDVFVAGEYEDAIDGNSTWATGDWNGDGDFTSRDLVFAFADGGFEQGPRQAIQAVPEPACIPELIALFLLPFFRRSFL